MTVSETTTREETKREKPAKRGLHGWKAALAVFGCGTLAAFGVFGVIVGLLSTLVSTVSEGISSGEGVSVPPTVGSVEPREEFLSDKFDLCAIIGSISSAGLTLDSGYPEPVDAGWDGGRASEDDLVRSGECSGSVNLGSAEYGPLDFEFSYRSIVFHPGEEKDEISQDDLLDWREEFEERGAEVVASGERDFLDEGYYFYGDGEGGSFYHLIARKRSSVVSMSFSSTQSVSEGAYEGASNSFENRLEEDLNVYIPE